MLEFPKKVFIWKVDKFSEKLRNAIFGEETCVFSDPFFSHPCGYKMRLFFYPNGDDETEKGNACIYIQVLKGKLDNILKWPVEFTATLMLLDQKEGKNHLEGVVTSDDDNLYIRQKPTQHENDGWGFDLAPLKTVQSDVYLVENSIFIKAIVEIHNMT